MRPFQFIRADDAKAAILAHRWCEMLTKPASSDDRANISPVAQRCST